MTSNLEMAWIILNAAIDLKKKTKLMLYIIFLNKWPEEKNHDAGKINTSHPMPESNVDT